ncbi:hypothetical protein J7E73_08790 [Paenibacillus albidus]|uniref:hypothetical protein n=1 Tax=Paenibacillus albidus TaxID=2041023 RepID=UPI001BE86A61|nr:hypothetical protein [Paenibacillus albidus]MBT2289228.1 hypothetical protein [Paenibacillus albidus]
MLLLRKMVRDIWQTKSQFLTILIIVACGVFTYVGTITVGNRLEESVTGFYTETRLNDLWINVTHANESDVTAIKQLPGVDEAQGRTVDQVFSGNRRVEQTIRVPQADRVFISKTACNNWVKSSFQLQFCWGLLQISRKLKRSTK